MEPAATIRKESLGETVLSEIRQAREEVAVLKGFADLLGRRSDGESFMEVVVRLLGLLVAGTEETHRRLEALHATVTEPGIARAMRLAILED